MTAVPEPVDYAHVIALSMNMSGRFSGREIRCFGQKVIRHILAERRVRLFVGQQINFKPQLPDRFRFVGTNKAFLCYDGELFRANDEKQYRHFLRDLHLRGQLPHHYLPDNNYVVMKMRYRQKPWSEFIAMSWVTDEKQARLKNACQLRKVINYAMHLSEAEEMPVFVGGTFRMQLNEIKMEMDGDFRCYGYLPGTPRRNMRASNVFICAKPLKMCAVKPVVCAKMTIDNEQYSRWLNPEDAFYWDPVIGEILLPIQTPESLDKARRHEQDVDAQLRQRSETSSQTRPITGISSKHLLISSTTMRPSGILLPTAPVLPTPQEQVVAPPPSPVEPSPCEVPHISGPVSLGDVSCLLPAIDEVSSEYERRDSACSNTDTLISDNQTQVEQEREDKIFELLEAMMNDKSSTFFVRNEQAEGSREEASNLDPVIFNLLKSDRPQSLDELKATIRVRIQSGVCSSENLPENIAELLNYDVPLKSSPESETGPSSERYVSEVDQSPIQYTEVESTMLAKLGRIPSYQELYDEDLIQNSTQCYMS
ncbi:hypothetical protein LSH36_385g00009 [Paralvinella palmiformis]|uniref:Uncharacterized protein n=1 Tax=Paralvinella palmiformis TaxID=53620 RepID=A0AAD9MZ62_9ANNE|nr:hypothetical protein LSH36_385g00009 [Paralvinella palmiformis]